MDQLRILRDMAKSARQFSAAISAEVKRGELMRFYVKQVESTRRSEFADMSDEELEAYILESYEQIKAHKALKRRTSIELAAESLNGQRAWA